MLKPLIWGSQAPEWEDDEAGRLASQQASQNSATAAAAAAKGSKRKYSQDHPHQHLAATSTSAAAPSPRPRGNYDPARGGTALLGPLSVNDPQLEPHDRGDRFVLSESFLNIASPFGPFGTGNEWRILQKDAPEHVHRLLRALVAAQDYAGAARALATLHRLHSAFDPDVYRFTVALLRLSANHQKTSLYFRKILGKKARSIKRRRMLQGRAIALDFLAYLADKHKYDEALNVSQNLLQGGSLSNNGAFKHDPLLKAHVAVLQLFAALLEHQASARDTSTAGSDTATTSTTGSATAAAAADGDGRRRRQSSPPPRRVPDLQDPLSMIGHLRACWSECAGAQMDSPRGRAHGHLKRAKQLLEQAATGLPGDASVAGYRAAATAAESGMVAALRQLEHFAERNPGSVKGRALHTRLLEMTFREARRGVAAAAAAVNGGSGNGGGLETSGRNRRPGAGDGYGRGKQRNQTRRDGEQVDAAQAGHNNNDDDERLLLVGVARARALRGWLETDPLEPRASLALASLLSAGSGAVVGVADRTFVVDSLVRQLETSCGLPRSCPSASRGVLYTTRAATALWAALADLLGSLRVRDEPVPVVRRGAGGGGLKRSRSTTTAATSAAGAAPPLPPRPGTIWDHLYGADPPWAPTDFACLEQGGGFSPCGGSGRGYIDGVGGVLEETEGAGELADSESAGLGSSPHPLLRGVDRELWGETVLDPGGEPLLLAETTRVAAGKGGEAAAENEEAETWCSDDEDCASGNESELLREHARLASRRTGGCLYYRPPGGEEEGLRTRATGQEKKRPFFEATTAGIVLEGMADVMEERDDGHGEDGRGESVAVVSAGLGETSEVEEEENEEEEEEEKGGGPTGSAMKKRRHRHPRRGRAAREGQDKQGVAAACDEGASSEDGGRSGRASKQRRRRCQREKAFSGAARGGSSSSSGGGGGERNRRGDIDSEDDADADADSDSDADAEVEFIGSVMKKAKKTAGVVDPDYTSGDDDNNDDDDDDDDDDDESANDGDDEDDDGDGEDGEGGPALREPEAVLGRPVGTDAAATRLSETVSVALPQEAAVWLLADKCLVAAHMFGPQHRFCLRAIWRLCREDLREPARLARAALRRQGFRLQLSLTRLAAANARSKAVKEGRKPSVAWGLPEPPSAARNALPFDRPASTQGRHQRERAVDKTAGDCMRQAHRGTRGQGSFSVSFSPNCPRCAQDACGVAGGCAALGTCDDGGYEGDCAAPGSLVCEHQLPGLNVCESPPMSAMLPCWMSGIDGSLRLNQISIPGTHNTMAKGISACLQEGRGNYVHTQAWSLRTMLDAGVRAVDIRLRHKSDLSLVLEHGIVELPLAFDEDVRDVLASFLSDNPTETVLMFYQINDLSPAGTAAETLRASMEAYPDLWLEGSTIPTLDEARGKVVVPVNMGRESQDEYDLGTFGAVSEKKALIREFFLESGATPAVGGPFRVNYFSGTGVRVYPLTVAAGLKNIYQGTNEVVFEFSGGCLGVTMFDFVGEDAVAHVVAQQGTTGPSWDEPSVTTGSPDAEVSGAA
eukprot:g9853.t1